MLGWIPIIGPIIDGIFSIFRKTIDLKAVKYKVDGSVDIESIKAGVQVIEATKDDIGLRLCRDILCFPVAVWASLYTWDTIMAYGSHRAYMWMTPDFPPQMAWYPLAVLTFLLGNQALNVWKLR